MANSSANEHDALHIFKRCHDSIKGVRVGTRRHLLETNNDDWEDSLSGLSTARALMKDLSD